MSSANLAAILKVVYGATQGPGGTFVPYGMATSELEILAKLVCENECCRALEIGMANGTSTIAILHGSMTRNGVLTSIDPFQHSMCDGKGLDAVQRSGYADRHTLLEEPDYFALPRLLQAGTKFDFIFIDGNHALDFTLLDFFYADLLLTDGGIVAFHDTSLPGVFATTQWVERHKLYQRLSPRARRVFSSWIKRTARRFAVIMRRESADFEARRTVWRTLAAYQKGSGATNQR